MISYSVTWPYITENTYLDLVEERDRLRAENAAFMKHNAELMQRPLNVQAAFTVPEEEMAQLLDHSCAETWRLRAALTDMLSGWRYIRRVHGELSGVGWERCEQMATAALAPERTPDAP